ncbi:MAG: [Clostridia bacterium]|nr:[FeFe] hydrogenase H-cluster radical SAM maturase HydE [Clostridia bacterium]
MKENIKKLIDTLASDHRLEREEYLTLIENCGEEEREYLASLARAEREKHYGRDVYIRGLIEISNICKNDCYYCGIRASNKNCDRYRLTQDEILECCEEGYALGFRTFVMQGGEDGHFTDDVLEELLEKIKSRYPDCAVTLSLGERSRESYQRLKAAGADRYLLRHETATESHYGKLHPPTLTWANRMRCLTDLRELGYQVGCGFMVGSPYQTAEMLADELVFIERFKPDMCGIGPFIPHKDTDFRDMPHGSVDLTCMLLSCIRLIHPTVLLPATTALGSLEQDGRERGILSGANVVMPNLSPASVRKKYMLYDNKLSDGAESAQAKTALEERMNSIGYRVAVSRGDAIKRNN